MPSFILALDQGTTSSRSVLFDERGTPVASAQREFQQYFPQPGWVEHDANEIWHSQRATIDDVLARAGISATELAAIGIANQRETVVLWDRKTGEPLAPAIVWQDRRTAERCQQLKAAGHEPMVTARTGLLLDPYFSATKLAWLLDRLPNARSRADNGELAFGTIDSWLAFKLCAGRQHITDPSNASRTLLFNINTCDWDDELLTLFNIPRACLPKIVPSSARSAVAILDGTAVTLGGQAGDQQAALFGQACFRPGMAKNTYGTGCFLLMNCGAVPLASRHRLISTVAWQREQYQYALEGSVFVAGAVVQWLRDGLRLIDHAAEIEALACTETDNGGVYLVPAFTGLGSPHWDPFARGSMQGLTRGTTRGHIARAALESIAFQSAELLDAVQLDSQQPLVELRVDGGASANNLLMQFQADLLGVTVVRSRIAETTALGAAYLAGLAVGFWSSEDELAKQWQIDRRFEPQLNRDRAAEMRSQWSRALTRARGWENGQ